MLVLLGSGFGMFLNIFRGFGIDFWWQAVIQRSKELLYEDASNAKRACAVVQVVISSCTLHYTKQLFISIRLLLGIFFSMNKLLACKL